MALETVHIGLGPIGQSVVRAAAATGAARPVLLVDSSPELVERFAGEFMSGIPVWVAEQPVVEDLASAWEWVVASSVVCPSVAVIATGSRLTQVADTILDAVRCGLNVVSTCEELAFPWLRHRDLADEIHAAALENGVTVLGVGVNPGFVADLLPALLASRAALNVRRVFVERVVDARRRRVPLQRKIGAGLSPKQFEDLAQEGKIGHVGLAESACLVAEALGVEWKGNVRETIVPVLAEQEVASDGLYVAPGSVRGIEQVASVEADGAAITLRLRMALGEPDEHDHIQVEGDPPIDLTLRPCIHGDQATVACVVNSLEAVVQAAPGLKTVLDLPVATRCSRNCH
ncbi:MAG: dihydrodipicolinate reductase [Armatimonadetes bacterium]|nr:dihydrodipicolinate reductase [Armatimonadota bacterium]